MDDVEPSLPLPRPAAIAAALRVTTERLAQELSRPQSAPPDWSGFQWRAARAVAAMHGVSGILADTLRWRGAPGWRHFLTSQREHIASRHLRIQQLIRLVDEELRARGITGLALKGAALHAQGLYQAGERPMGDVDLLVRPEHVEITSGLLIILGFRESLRTVKHRVFTPRHSRTPVPFGEHADNDIKIELHERIMESLPVYPADITQHVFPQRARPGLLTSYPSAAALMGHLLLHAAGGVADRSVRLVQLHDIALLARRLTAPDWDRILSWHPWWAFPPLMLAERYYGALAASDIKLRLRECCPFVLRRVSSRQLLSDVSLSRLWVDAFPGLAWARSTREVVSYVSRRVVPDARLQVDRVLHLQSMPVLAEDNWAALTQGRRILRFLAAPTPRPLPLHNVRAALAQRP
jgi:hypothetical protein